MQGSATNTSVQSASSSTLHVSSLMPLHLGSHEIIMIWFLVSEQLTIYPGLVSKCRKHFADIHVFIVGKCCVSHCMWSFNLIFAQFSACMLVGLIRWGHSCNV